MTNKELMRRAIELSKQSVRNGGGPFGAVIARIESPHLDQLFVLHLVGGGSATCVGLHDSGVDGMPEFVGAVIEQRCAVVQHTASNISDLDRTTIRDVGKHLAPSPWDVCHLLSSGNVHC